MRFARAASLFLSLLLHAAAVFLLIAGTRFPHAAEETLRVDLTRLEPSPASPNAPSPPETAEPETPRNESPPPPAEPTTPSPAAAPVDEAQAEASIPAPPQPFETIPDRPLPADAESEPPAPEPPPRPGAAPDPPDATEPAPEFDAQGRRVIRVGSPDGLAHRGHEGRFGGSLMGAVYSHSSREYAGSFVTPGGRHVTVIDARETEYGRFLLYDSAAGTLRRLKKFNKYIYTIGPSLTEDEPVTGSVTFLARDDRIERFIYMPDDDTKALFPGKIHFEEQELSVPCHGVRLRAALVLPDGETGPLAVLVHDGGCMPLEASTAAARALAAGGIAAAAFVPRGCVGGGEPIPDGLTEDAHRTLAYLRRKHPARCDCAGYVAIDGAARAAVDAATIREAAFVAVVFTEARAPEALPDAAALRKLDVPSLWIFPQRGNGYGPLWETLHRLRQGGLPITVRKSPRDNAIPLGSSEESGSWVLPFGAADASVAAKWIARISAQ